MTATNISNMSRSGVESEFESHGEFVGARFGAGIKLERVRVDLRAHGKVSGSLS